MSSASYQLTDRGLMLNHGLQGLLSQDDYVADLDDGRELNEADALAASGDYFIALASRLDHLAQSVPMNSAEQIELEHIVSTLLYVQRHYTVVAKSKLRQ